jgi:two-component system nitrate/nitrite response regulator NarL
MTRRKRPSDPPLSPRETEILRLIAKGLTTDEIADELGTARATVRTQTQTILLRLGVHNRTEAVVLGIKLGIVPFPFPESVLA